MRTRPGPSRFSNILLAHAVQLIEDQGPLEDGEAMSQAFRAQSGREERLFERARLLARRLRLDGELARWRELALFIWLGLAVLVFAISYGIAATLLGGGRSLNAVLAFFGVLGMHALTLLLWLTGLAWSRLSPASGTGRISLGSLFLRLVAWLPVDRGPHSLTLARATRDVFRRSRLGPWAFGFISHSIWAAAFVLVLFALWFGFSFREYRLTWETTILQADFFIGFVQWTGWLPGLLGFPVPDTSTLLRPEAAGSDQRAWAWWLIGCTLVYGLLTRAILAALCWLNWRRGRNAIRLDTTDPYFRKLLARFDQMEQSAIVDVEQRPPSPAQAAHDPGRQPHSRLPALIAFELPDEYEWPLQDVLPLSQLNERIAGSSQERRKVLDRLAQLQPQKLLVACSAASTPDRGTERFLREARASVAHCAVLLLAPAGTADRGMQRWQAWLVDTGMGDVRLWNDTAQAAAWLGDEQEGT